jgi:hypothetical protein
VSSASAEVAEVLLGFGSTLAISDAEGRSDRNQQVIVGALRTCDRARARVLERGGNPRPGESVAAFATSTNLESDEARRKDTATCRPED